MALLQLGEKVNLKAQGIKNAKEREASGSITLKSLKEVANAMDMQLVYALVPKKNQ